MRLSIATKIFIAFTMMLVTFGAVLIFQITRMRAIYNEVELINAGYVPLSVTINDVRSDLRSYSVVLNEKDPQVLKKTLVASRSLYNFPEQIDLKLQRAQEHVEGQLQLPLDDAEREFLGVMQQELRETRELNAEFRARSDRFAEAVLANRAEEADSLQAELRRMERRLATRVRASQRLLREQIDRALLRTQRGESSAFGAAIGLSVIALFVSAGIMLVVQLTVRPLRVLTEGAKRIATGDYSPIPAPSSRDEIGLLADEFNTMVRTIADRDAALREQAKALAEANQGLLLLRNLNEDILNSVGATIIAVDRAGRVTAANRAAQLRFRLDPARAVGADARGALPLSALDEPAARLREVIEQGDAHTWDALPIEVNGESILLDVALLPLKTTDPGQGHIQGALIVADDVTERVRTKEALIKSERLAAVGEIATKVTHELRNPLSTIRLNAELLSDELTEHGLEPTSEPQATLRAIIGEVERLGALTEDYLRFARLPEPNPLPGDLNALVESVVDFQRDDLELGGVDVQLELAPELPTVRLDDNQLRRALINLIRNAREAMEHAPTRRLTVRTADASTRCPLPGAPTTVEVVIDDTGAGIAADKLARIFEPFFSLKEKGTGLGLPLTLQIVEEHGGRLECDSTPGVGTRFTLLLPGLER